MNNQDSPANNNNNSIKMETSSHLPYHRDAHKFGYDPMQAGRFPFPPMSVPHDGQEVDYSDSHAAYYAQSSMYGAAPPPYQCMAPGLRPLYQSAGGPSLSVPPINANGQWDRYARP